MRTYKNSSSIESLFVGLAGDNRTNDYYRMISTSDDKLGALGFLWGLSTIIQSVGSMLLSHLPTLDFLYHLLSVLYSQLK